MTPIEVKTLSNAWQGYRSQISYFLSRLTLSGVLKILDDKELFEEDFIGHVSKVDKSQEHINRPE
jgi:hypothetical protein